MYKIIYNNFGLNFETKLLDVKNLKICPSMKYPIIRNQQFYMTELQLFARLTFWYNSINININIPFFHKELIIGSTKSEIKIIITNFVLDERILKSLKFINYCYILIYLKNRKFAI